MSVIYDDDNDNDEQRTYFDQTFSSGELKTDALRDKTTGV